MTVDQYLAVFTRFARFFPELVSTEDKKARKFQKGLRRDVGGRIASNRFEIIEAVVLATNRAQEFNTKGTLKRPAQSAPTYDNRANKKPNFQLNRPPLHHCATKADSHSSLGTSNKTIIRRDLREMGTDRSLEIATTAERLVTLP